MHETPGAKEKHCRNAPRPAGASLPGQPPVWPASILPLLTPESGARSLRSRVGGGPGSLRSNGPKAGPCKLTPELRPMGTSRANLPTLGSESQRGRGPSEATHWRLTDATHGHNHRGECVEIGTGATTWATCPSKWECLRSSLENFLKREACGPPTAGYGSKPMVPLGSCGIGGLIS